MGKTKGRVLMNKKRLVLVSVVGLLFFVHSKTKGAFTDGSLVESLSDGKNQEPTIQNFDRVAYIDLNAGAEQQETSVQEYNLLFEPGGKFHQYAAFKPDFGEWRRCEQLKNREADEFQCLNRYIENLMKIGREKLARDSCKK